MESDETINDMFNPFILIVLMVYNLHGKHIEIVTQQIDNFLSLGNQKSRIQEAKDLKTLPLAYLL